VGVRVRVGVGVRFTVTVRIRVRVRVRVRVREVRVTSASKRPSAMTQCSAVHPSASVCVSHSRLPSSGTAVPG
jgi:hypothetical protein